MKKITQILIFLALSFNLLAQPTTITWQGKLLDASGNAITQNNVAMTFAMFDASTGGTQLWPASGVVTKTVNVAQGLYSVQLGTGVGDDIAFTAALFDGLTPWLEVKVGTETLPRTEITNVPFALISNDLSAAGWENPGEIGKTTPNTGKFTSVETGSMKITTGAGNNKILSSDNDGDASWSTLSSLETDPIFGVSLASQISASDTTRWGLQYWNKTGNDLFYQNGKIGIGTSDPSTLLKAPLNVEGGIRYSGGIGGTGYAGQLYYDPADTGTFRYVDNLGRHKVFGAGSINYSGTLWTLNTNDLYTDKDVITTGGLGVGFDVTPGYGFNFVTLWLHEDNVRIRFDDHSTIAGFASTDWQLTANESGSGGMNYFAIEDITDATIPFKVLGAAPTNSLVVSAAGNTGFGTLTPARKIHVNDAMRLQPTSEPASPAAGDFYFDSISDKLRYHNGTTWQNLESLPDLPTLWTFSDDDFFANGKDVVCNSKLAVGAASVSGQSFGKEILLLKYDNIRIKFDDNSVSPWPANDWQITINDSVSGGAGYFAIEDITASRVPFKIMANAPNNSIYIDKYGRLGLKTLTPTHEIHMKDNDTPTIRFEQDDTSGWAPQTWDIGANEANFFIRDVTAGSLMPFRIKPGSPTNSLTINNGGNVGIGTWSPQQKLHVSGIMRLEPVDEPATAGEGDIYYDKNTHKARCYDGSAWHDLW